MPRETPKVSRGGTLEVPKIYAQGITREAADVRQSVCIIIDQNAKKAFLKMENCRKMNIAL